MKRAAFAFFLYSLITVALTYPLVAQLGSAFPHDPGDPALNTWILWWNARTVPFTTAWWNAPAFHPVPGVLSFSESLLGLSVVASPIQWLGGSPLLAYNIVFLLTFPLCALGAYVLALELTHRHDAAFIAGLLFGFAPYRMSHLPHIQVLAAFGMPFALAALHRYLRDPRPRWLILFGAAWLLQALSNGYYLLFFSLLVGIWLVWFVPPTRSPKAFAAIFAAGCVAVLPLLPLLWQYRAIHSRLGFVRDFGTIRHFGADVLALFSTEQTLALWGWLQLYRRPEGQLFPGMTIVLLVLLSIAMLWRRTEPTAAMAEAHPKWRLARRVLFALFAATAVMAALVRPDDPWQFSVFGYSLSAGNPVKVLTWSLAFGILLVLTSSSIREGHRRSSVLVFYAVAAFVMWLLSLGPAPTLMGEELMYRGPYALLMNLPGFNALRVPARFWMMSALCLAAIAAILFNRLGMRFGAMRRVLAALIVLGALADAWIWRFPLAPVPDVWRTAACVPREAKGAVLELPFGGIVTDVGAMYRSILHERPTINGYSGYFPPHYFALRAGLESRDQDVLSELAAHDLEYVIIDTGSPHESAFREYVARQPGAELICSTDAHVVYRFPRVAIGPEPLVRSVVPVAAVGANRHGEMARLMIDNDLQTRWESGPQQPGTMVEVDLGAVRAVSALELSLASATTDFPRGLRIETSIDRSQWRQLWSGSSTAAVVAGALLDPRAVPVVYRLAPVSTRFFRLWLTGRDERFPWSIAELKVLGS